MALKTVDIVFLSIIVLGTVGGLVSYERSQQSEHDPESAPFSGSSDPSVSTDPVTGGIESKDPTGAGELTRQTLVEDSGKSGRQKLPQPQPLEKGKVHLGIGASLGGIRPFPDDNPWNTDISQAPVDPLSELIILTIGAAKHVHPDFAAGYWEGAPTGIPYVVVDGKQAPVPIVYTAYGDESDPGPYPIPGSALIEGHPNTEGDRHVIVIDRDNWKLYELFRAFSIGDGQLWRAESGAIFDLRTNELRPEGWTSADAAGLPVFPGLVRYDEVVELGEVRHALRFTVQRTRRAFVPPARHWASRDINPSLPPMGMRVRLKQDFDLSEFPAEAQVILTALKKYGMILADNGSDWYISGAPDPRWNDESLRTLKKVKGDDFEVIRMEGLVIEP